MYYAGSKHTRGFAVSQMLQSWLATMNSEGPHGINTLPHNQTCTELYDMVSSDVFHTLLTGTNSPVHLQTDVLSKVLKFLLKLAAAVSLMLQKGQMKHLRIYLLNHFCS